MKTKLLGVVAAVALLFTANSASQVRAAEITYTIGSNLPLNNTGSGSGAITGTITTDGSLGSIYASDIVSWDLTVTVNCSGCTATYSPSNTEVLPGFSGDGNLMASPTTLSFDFNNYVVTGDAIVFGNCTSSVCYSYAGDGVVAIGYGRYSGAVYKSDGGIGGAYTTTTENDEVLAVVAGSPSATPLPAALPLFAGGLSVIGLLGWRRKRKAAPITA
jgi:hypothetical protein